MTRQLQGLKGKVPEGPFTCNICGKTYRKRFSFNGHLRAHAGETECFVCNKSFNYSKLYEYPYLICGLSMRGVYTICARQKGEQGRHVCVSCGNSYRHKSNLYKHMKSHTGETLCHLCHKVFSRTENLHKHLANCHGGLQRYPCEVCGRSYRHKSNLHHHMKTHTGETICHLCHKVFSRVENLQKHLASPGPPGDTVLRLVPLCAQACIGTNSPLLPATPVRYATAHIGTRPACTSTWTPTRETRAAICVRRGERGGGLRFPLKRRHVSRSRTEHGTSIAGAGSASDANRGPQGYPCKICGRSYRHTTSLHHHMKTHTGETICHLCHKMYSRIENLHKHLAYCHGVR
uniref:Uncharacterized protein n=1 Tax=Timema shepardi TaxID=629360 RepID=A0A7R9G6W7_TIMSH|nr:unnamed protein product [Timema shepardi]